MKAAIIKTIRKNASPGWEDKAIEIFMEGDRFYKRLAIFYFLWKRGFVKTADMMTKAAQQKKVYEHE